METIRVSCEFSGVSVLELTSKLTQFFEGLCADSFINVLQFSVDKKTVGTPHSGSLASTTSESSSDDSKNVVPTQVKSLRSYKRNLRRRFNRRLKQQTALPVLTPVADVPEAGLVKRNSVVSQQVGKSNERNSVVHKVKPPDEVGVTIREVPKTRPLSLPLSFPDEVFCLVTTYNNKVKREAPHMPLPVDFAGLRRDFNKLCKKYNVEFTNRERFFDLTIRPCCDEKGKDFKPLLAYFKTLSQPKDIDLPQYLPY